MMHYQCKRITETAIHEGILHFVHIKTICDRLTVFAVFEDPTFFTKSYMWEKNV